MNIVVYGAGYNGLRIYDRINSFYNTKYTIKAYIDREKEGFINNISIIRPEQYKDNDPVVISVGDRKTVLSIYKVLKQRKVQNIYLYLNLDNPCYDDFDFLENECIKMVGDGNELIHHMEVHAVDFCNLNCKACIHYAPLFKKEDFNKKMIYDDLRALAEFTKGIISLYIMGGEPLLRDDLADIVETARNFFPYTDIQILTNGILVPKYSKELWSVMKKNKVTLTVSEYKPTQKMRRDIEHTLKENQVPYLLRTFDTKDKFIKTLCLDRNSKYERTCICDGCINIYNGKISRCPAVMYLDKLNETFDISLPKDGIYNLSEMGSVTELNRKMKERIPLCDHCVHYEIEWSKCEKHLKLEDFVIMENK